MNTKRERVGLWSRNGLRYLVWVLIAVVAVLPALFLRQALEAEPSKNALKNCRELPAARASSGTGAIELQTNRARPTLLIALADKQSAVDTISFSSKDRQVVPDTPRRRTSALFIETPRRSAAEPFDGPIRARSGTVIGGTIVRLTVCVERGGVLKAGAFQGTVRIFGPSVADFDYAVIVTEKWPWEVALFTLWYAGLAFVLVAWRTRSLAFTGGEPWTTRVAGIGFGLLAMAPAFGAYWNNATWGSDPKTDVTGLATAGFTAALAGLAAAHKLLGGGGTVESSVQDDAERVDVVEVLEPAPEHELLVQGEPLDEISAPPPPDPPDPPEESDRPG